MPSEQKIQNDIKTLIENRGGYVVKVVTATKAGVPDLLVCYNGLFIGIEVKRPATKTNVSKLQQYNLQKIIDCGGRSLVAWEVEQVEEFLDLL